MNTELHDIGLALLLLSAAGLLVAWYLRYKASCSEWRMTSMLRRAGVDLEETALGGGEAALREIRRRCRNCQAEDVCERWLAEKFEGANTFCPNRRIIAEMAREAHVA